MGRAVAIALALLTTLSCAACAGENAGAAQVCAVPPLTIAPVPSNSAGEPRTAALVPSAVAGASATPTVEAASPDPSSARPSPVHPELIWVSESDHPAAPASSHVARGPRTTQLAFRACEQITVVVLKGAGLKVLGEVLRPGDIIVVYGYGVFPLKSVAGVTTALLATVQPPSCEPVLTNSPITHAVVRGDAAPELSWAAGQMHARLDVSSDVSPNAYVGRLRGTAPVAEHVHAQSWEIICALEASGTFTRDGKEQRLAPFEIVMVPPGVKHAWRPDPGTQLQAVQIYAPPGPEERFKALAASSASAGGDAGTGR